MGTIEQAVGREMRRRREAAGVGQAAIAAAARQYGLPWTRAMIAAVELGRKRLSLGELALLPLVLSEANVTGGRVLNLRDLIPLDEGAVDVGPGLQMPLRIARELLLGDGTRAQLVSAMPTHVSVDRRALEAAGDAEQKAAIALRVSPAAIVEAAHQAWGESLTACRDRLVAFRTKPMLKHDPDEALDPAWPRRLQAIRGHVTRELLEKLRPLLKGATKKGKGARR